MVHEAMLGKLLIFCALAAIVGEGVDADAATRGEDARHLDIFRVHEADEVLHDDVDAVFVEVAVVAETGGRASGSCSLPSGRRGHTVCESRQSRADP